MFPAKKFYHLSIKGAFTMTYTYQTKGTCSKQIELELDENHIIRSVAFTGGCNGYLK